ncbi:MAG: patatin-like phospholipase family protein [Candidatus Obscuribacterales bacterium]
METWTIFPTIEALIERVEQDRSDSKSLKLTPQEAPSAEQLGRLGSALEANGWLEAIDLSQTREVASLLPSLARISTLTKVVLNGSTTFPQNSKERITHCLSRALNIRWLDISDAGPSPLRWVVEGLFDNRSIDTLVACRCDEKGALGLRLAADPSTNPLFQQLLTVNNTLTRLDLSGCWICWGTSNLIDFLCTGAESNGTLRELVLANCHLFDRGATRVGQMLKTNQTLALLDLSFNFITDKGARALAEGLEENGSVEVLSLVHEADFEKTPLGAVVDTNISTNQITLSSLKLCLLDRLNFNWASHELNQGAHVGGRTDPSLLSAIALYKKLSPKWEDYEGLRALGRIPSFLLSACSRGDLATMQTLNRLKVDFTLVGQQERDSLVRDALKKGSTQEVKFLLSKGLWPEAMGPFEVTPVHFFATTGDLELLRYCVEELERPVSIPSKEGILPIHLAVGFRKMACASYLLSQGARLTDRSGDGKAPVHYLFEALKKEPLPLIGQGDASDPFPETLEFLDRLGCDFNVQDNKGWTPLHHAVHLKEIEVARWLIDDCNVNVDVEDANGKSPRQMVGENNLSDLLDLMNRIDLERQSKPSKVENLVFEGGGIKGLAYLGAYEAAIDRLFIPDQIKRYGGASAGSLTALLLFLGYDAVVLRELIENLNFEEWFDHKDSQARELALKILAGYREGSLVQDSLLGIFNPWEGVYNFNNANLLWKGLSTHKGIFEGNRLLEWLRERVTKGPSNKSRDMHATFRDFREKFGCPRELYVITVDVNTGATRTLSYETTPDMPIADAIRMSVAIPLIFRPHGEYRMVDKGGGVVKRELVENSHYYTDGGWQENYPIHLFDQDRYLHRSIRTGYSRPVFNGQTLGFRIMSTDPNRSNVAPTLQTAQIEQIGLVSFMGQLLRGLYNKQESDYARSLNPQRTVELFDEGIDSLQFALPPDHREKLYRSGQRGVERFIQMQGVRSKPTRKTLSSSLFSLLKHHLNDLPTSAEHGQLVINFKALPSLSPREVYRLFQSAKADELDDLIQLEIPLSSRDENGETALHLAAKDPKATPSVVSALITGGLLPGALSKSAKTPSQLAQEAGNVNIAQLLEKAHQISLPVATESTKKLKLEGDH